VVLKHPVWYLARCPRNGMLILVRSSKRASHLNKVQMQVEVHFVSDVLRGNDTTEMRLTLIRYIDDELPPDDE
jgi:hypothetical protein